MTDFNLKNIIELLINNGIEITIKLHNDVVVYDVNTGAKSNLYLEEKDGVIYAHTGYNPPKIIEGFSDLFYDVKDCMCRRDSINENWAKLLVKKDIMKRIETTSVKYQ
jgi:hypothetical protein